MQIVTLTLDAQTYMVAALTVWILGASAIAGRLTTQFGILASWGFISTYIGIMFVLAALSLLFLELPHVTELPALRSVVWIPAGIAAGLAARGGELALRRFRIRRGLKRNQAPGLGQRSATGYLPQMSAERASSASTLGGVHPPGRARATLFNPLRGLLGLLLVAALEEILFRGVLIDVALDLHSIPTTWLALIGTVLGFALIHSYAGWGEVVGKFLLGNLCLILVLTLGSAAPAVVAHSVVNLAAWHAGRFPSAAGIKRFGS